MGYGRLIGVCIIGLCVTAGGGGGGCNLRKPKAAPKPIPGLTPEGQAVANRTTPWPVSRFGKQGEALLADGREWFARLMEKYNETGTLESDPLLATRLVKAWQQDADAVGKLKRERLEYALGMAVGDAISARTGLPWRAVGDNHVLALATDDGMLVVYPLDIAQGWILNFNAPNLKDLTGKIQHAQQHDRGRVRTFIGVE